MQGLEPRRLLASVVVFDNPNYVDTAGSFDSESDNIQASLAALGHTVTTFTGIEAADFSAALSGKQVLLIPEQENNVLAPDLSADALAAIRNFVAGGGGLIVNGFAGDTPGLLNAAFGYSLREVFGSTTQRTFEAAATAFAANVPTLPWNDGTSALTLSSLPDNAFTMYDDGFASTVTLFRYGAGQIVFLGWDWYFSTPPNAGGQNNGWQPVLGSAVTQVTATRNPNAPRASAGGPHTVEEGVDTVQFVLDASGTTDPNQAAETLTYLWDLDHDGLFGETGAAATYGNERGINPTFTATAAEVFDGPHGFRVLLRVIDSTGLGSASSANLRVLNVAPTADVDGPATTVAAAPLELALTATDPSPADQLAGFAYEVDWGDGTFDFFFGPGEGTTAVHVYSLSGPRTVSVVAIDKDGDRGAPATHDLIVQSAGLAPDPFDPGKTALFIAGTEHDDLIRVAKKNKKSPLVVTINGAKAGSFSPKGRIIVTAGAGNDRVEVASSITLMTELDGGDGNDTVSGGGGADVILGRDGNDWLAGNNGRDFIIGGIGMDTTIGGDGDDLLIAGFTDYEFDPFGRQLIMAEWTRTDQNYERRVDHLRFGSGLNLYATLWAYDDSEADVLTGGKGDDWFFSHVSSPVRDMITDLRSSEFSTEVFFF